MPEGTVPEMVLVIELSGPVDSFRGALRKAGLEWLDELEIDEVAPDDDFFIVDKEDEPTDKAFATRVYLSMSNQQALAELQSLWRRWRDDPETSWDWGEGAWKEVFPRIRDIRPWSAEDRLRDTGLETAWQTRLAAGDEFVRFEAELWYRQSIERRQRSVTSVQRIVEAAGGQVLRTADIPEIRYHAVLGRISSGAAAEVLAHTDVELLRADDVMFLRPTGQVSAPGPTEDALLEIMNKRARPTPSDADPVVAVLDGMPVENHELLDGLLVVDDPEGWAAGIPVSRRFHGTCIASLVLHGDLGADELPSSRRIYVRPVLKPHPWPTGSGEFVPDDELPVDLMHRAVRRLFESTGGVVPAAPSVRIINLSIGDACRVFASALSPWAKLLDWLAWHYQVLFIVSAGNHVMPLQLDIPQGGIATTTREGLQAEVLRVLVATTRNRRLLAPAESVNAITVGALHRDASAAPLRATYHVDPFIDGALPSPISAHGLGYRRAVKPDVLIPGGRQIYETPPVSAGAGTVLQTLGAAYAAPGQLVAAPGTAAGELDRVLHSRGTSNAAALATRLAAELYEVVDTLRGQQGGESLNDRSTAVLVKTLLVHGADWTKAEQAFDRLLRPQVGGRKLREYISRFLGYGEVVPGYAAACTDQRVTLLGCGALTAGHSHGFSLPLPPSLSGVAVLRKLTITLSWMSPIAPGTQKYRRAHLWFAPSEHKSVAPTRAFYDHQAVSRGSVQHEVFSGDKAAIFQDGDVLNIAVNCREDAPSLDEAVPYGLAVTLEVAEGAAIPIYEEVRARIQTQVEVRPSV